MDEFLDTHSFKTEPRRNVTLIDQSLLMKLNQWLKKKKKCHKVQDFTGEFYKTFYEELQFSFSHYSKNLKRKKHF